METLKRSIAYPERMETCLRGCFKLQEDRKAIMGNFWVWFWTLIFLGVTGLQCFAHEFGLECFQPAQIGFPVNKNLFPSSQIFVVCIYSDKWPDSMLSSYTETSGIGKVRQIVKGPSSLQPLSKSQDATVHNQGHFRVNGLYSSSLTGG